MLTAVLPALFPCSAAEFSAQGWGADNGQDRAVFWGARFEHAGWRADILQGTFNPGGDTERRVESSISACLQAGFLRVGAGGVYHAVDTRLRPGWQWSYAEERTERNADLFGPLLYAEASLLPGGSSWDVLLVVSAMPADLGDLRDHGYDGSFLEGELRLGRAYRGMLFQAGYRVREYGHLPGRVINDRHYERDFESGVTVAIGFPLW